MQSMHKPGSQAGLTLIELLVVLAIVAILATVAYPFYTEQGRKARRADAKAALTSIALAEERFYTIQNRYSVTMTSLVNDAGLESSYSGGASEYYDLTLTGGGQSFTATATADASGPQASDSTCQTFTINQLGQQQAANSASGNTSDECW